MARRDAFTELHTPLPMSNMEENQMNDSTIRLQQPLDLIPTADRRKKRSRNWEHIHKQETVTYRGIPREVVNQIGVIAQTLSVPRDEIVRAFLEYEIRLYQIGELKLIAYPKAQRMTLYPEVGQGTTVLKSPKNDDQSWLSKAFPISEKKPIASKEKKSKKDQKLTPAWEKRVTFRIPVLLQDEVRKIAREHTLPVGEVVRFFVMEGIKASQGGKLQLLPSPKAIGKTLFQGED